MYKLKRPTIFCAYTVFICFEIKILLFSCNKLIKIFENFHNALFNQFCNWWAVQMTYFLALQIKISFIYILEIHISGYWGSFLGKKKSLRENYLDFKHFINMTKRASNTAHIPTNIFWVFLLLNCVQAQLLERYLTVCSVFVKDGVWSQPCLSENQSPWTYSLTVCHCWEIQWVDNGE